jgi:hypothetical protein
MSMRVDCQPESFLLLYAPSMMAKNMVGGSIVLTAVHANACLTHPLHRKSITTHTRVDLDGSATPTFAPESRDRHLLHSFTRIC